MNYQVDTYYMAGALEEARRAGNLGDVPVGAVIVCDHHILAKGQNHKERWDDPTAHAELIAIKEAACRLGTWRLLSTTLYVTLEPCCMCIGAIIQARIPRVVFGAYDPKGGACGSLLNIPAEPRLNHHVGITGGVLEDSCGEILQLFFQRRRKKATYA